MVQCLSKEYFGMECPGCGIQRSFISLFRGDILESIALYPALIPLLVLTIVGGVSIFKTFKFNLRIVLILAVLTVVIMVGHFILKETGNAPWYDEAAVHFHP